jgi:hypothetical protein
VDLLQLNLNGDLFSVQTEQRQQREDRYDEASPLFGITLQALGSPFMNLKESFTVLQPKVARFPKEYISLGVDEEARLFIAGALLTLRRE